MPQKVYRVRHCGSGPWSGSSVLSISELIELLAERLVVRHEVLTYSRLRRGTLANQFLCRSCQSWMGSVWTFDVEMNAE